MTLEPTVSTESPVTGTFLSMLGLVLIFTVELHHLMLSGIVESYRLFVPGDLPPIGDFAASVTRIVAESFRIGLQLSAPFLPVGRPEELRVGKECGRECRYRCCAVP